jgi:hypothetical protein
MLTGSILILMCCVLSIVSQGCGGSPLEPQQSEGTGSQSILPTVGKGPGGPANLVGKILSAQKVALGVIDLFVFDHRNYSDTLAHIVVTSSDGSFRISELPEDTVDVILRGSAINPWKEGDFPLVKGENQIDEYEPPGVIYVNIHGYSPDGKFILGAKFYSDPSRLGYLLGEFNCRIDTIWAMEPAGKFPGVRIYQLAAQDNQPLSEKFDALIFEQPVLFVEPPVYTSPANSSQYK